MAKLSAYDNVQVVQDDDKVVVTMKVGADVDARPSKSGKSVVIATSGGAIRVGDMYLNLTLYRKI